MPSFEGIRTWTCSASGSLSESESRQDGIFEVDTDSEPDTDSDNSDMLTGGRQSTNRSGIPAVPIIPEPYTRGIKCVVKCIMDTTDDKTAIRIRIPGRNLHRSSAKPLVIPIFIPHRGCPHRCRFCNQSAITGKSRQVTERISVKEEVLRFLSHCAPDRSPVEIAFFGGNFLGLSPQVVESYLQEAATMISSGAVDGIRFSTRPDTVTEETLEWIRPFPVTTIEIGAQSMVDRIIRLAGRGHDAKDTRAALGLVRKYNYRACVQLMVGLPGESESDVRDTGTQVADLEPDLVRIYPTVVLEGSALARSYEAGEYQPLSLSEAVIRTKVLYLLFLSSGIPVIRMGLPISSEPDLRDVVLAGPVHPAFGHLVLSEIVLDQICRELAHHPIAGARVILTAHPSNLSRLQGQNRGNLSSLRQKFRLKSVEAMVDVRLAADEIHIRIAE